jgi:arabinose-5-phosphate isomerase
MGTEAAGKLRALRRTTSPATSPLIEEARRVLRHQAGTLAELADRVDERFAFACEILHDTQGHVVVSGVGKSGIIGRKIASTLASTGTPALFVNAAEAHHGDLGMITERDTALLISYSGETEEVIELLPYLRSLKVRVIGLVGQLDSTLARSVDVVLDISVDREACPHNLAPTNSAMATLGMGDALAIALMRRRGFTSDDFARYHPGGTLGRRLLTRVKDVMRYTKLPVVAPNDTVGESLMTITEGRLGLVLVMSGERLVGLVTDGDLRRAMQRCENLLTLPVSEIMTRNPVTIDEDTLLTDAHQRMQGMKLKALVVLGKDGRVSGVIEVFDQNGP